MKSFLILSFIVLAFWSIITTFKAMYLILTRRFNGSKKAWILIVLIGIIGPILWVTKGKKLLEEKRKDI